MKILIEDKIFIIEEEERGEGNNNRKEKNQLTQTIFFFFTGESIPPPFAIFNPPDKAPYSSFNFFFVIRIISRAEAAEAKPATSLNFS